MDIQRTTTKRKHSYFFYFCSTFLFLVFSICAISSVFAAVFAPSIYNTLSYSYHTLRADLFYVQTNYQDAISNYTLAINLKPDNAYAYVSRGKAYAKEEDYMRAKLDFEIAINLDPSLTDAYNSLCWYGSLLGDADNVLSKCEQAVLLEPNNYHYRDSRGVARALTGDYQGAILDFQFFVNQAGGNFSNSLADIREREQWIFDLGKGINPFTSEELHKLLENDSLPDNPPPKPNSRFL